MASETKRRPVLETYTGANGRTLTFQLWDGYGNKLDGRTMTMTLKAKLGETVVFDDLAMTAENELEGLYYARYNFSNPGEHDAQIKVTNQAGDVDFCEPVTILVKEAI